MEIHGNLLEPRLQLTILSLHGPEQQVILESPENWGSPQSTLPTAQERRPPQPPTKRVARVVNPVSEASSGKAPYL